MGATLLVVVPLPGEGNFTMGSYGGVRSKNFCYDQIPEFLRDFETQYENRNAVSDNCLQYKRMGKLLIITKLGFSEFLAKIRPLSENLS